MEYHVERIGERHHYKIIGLKAPFDNGIEEKIFPAMYGENLVEGFRNEIIGVYHSNINVDEGDVFVTPVGKFVCYSSMVILMK